MNAERMYNSAQRLEMPPFPKDKFVEAVKQVVSANAAWVPPFGSGATLYVRPFMIGSGDVIGVAPAPEYTFRILVTPVGPYFKGGLKPVKLRVSEYDRAAPHGTGNIKAGLNYAMSLKPTMEAHREGYAENLYLDSESRTYVEETGGIRFYRQLHVIQAAVARHNYGTLNMEIQDINAHCFLHIQLHLQFSFLNLRSINIREELICQ